MSEILQKRCHIGNFVKGSGAQKRCLDCGY